MVDIPVDVILNVKKIQGLTTLKLNIDFDKQAIKTEGIMKELVKGQKKALQMEAENKKLNQDMILVFLRPFLRKMNVTTRLFRKIASNMGMDKLINFFPKQVTDPANLADKLIKKTGIVKDSGGKDDAERKRLLDKAFPSFTEYQKYWWNHLEENRKRWTEMTDMMAKEWGDAVKDWREVQERGPLNYNEMASSLASSLAMEQGMIEAGGAAAGGATEAAGGATAATGGAALPVFVLVALVAIGVTLMGLLKILVTLIEKIYRNLNITHKFYEAIKKLLNLILLPIDAVIGGFLLYFLRMFIPIIKMLMLVIRPLMKNALMTAKEADISDPATAMLQMTGVGLNVMSGMMNILLVGIIGSIEKTLITTIANLGQSIILGFTNIILGIVAAVFRLKEDDPFLNFIASIGTDVILGIELWKQKSIAKIDAAFDLYVFAIAEGSTMMADNVTDFRETLIYAATSLGEFDKKLAEGFIRVDEFMVDYKKDLETWTESAKETLTSWFKWMFEKEKLHYADRKTNVEGGEIAITEGIKGVADNMRDAGVNMDTPAKNMLTIGNNAWTLGNKLGGLVGVFNDILNVDWKEMEEGKGFWELAGNFIKTLFSITPAGMALGGIGTILDMIFGGSSDNTIEKQAEPTKKSLEDISKDLNTLSTELFNVDYWTLDWTLNVISLREEMEKFLGDAGVALSFKDDLETVESSMNTVGETMEKVAEKIESLMSELRSAISSAKAAAAEARSSGETSVSDAIITKDGKVIRTHPDDNIIATKGGVGGGTVINIHVDGYVGNERQLGEVIERVMYKSLRRTTGMGGGAL